ncbi:MAG TPA: hypothetical protein VJB57_16280 [Dehalococcoidia bacterium]|nr:hypothetical protein [Dehalococcoidia bacterium]
MTGPVSLCEVKSGLFRCKQHAAGLCQYCGRPFCAKHGERHADGQEICHRRFCVEKRDDLVKHLVYKEVVDQRNQAERCGIEGCGSSPSGQCVRCRGFFCSRHVEGREERIQVNQVLVPQLASLCQHCFVRRPIWLRM